MPDLNLPASSSTQWPAPWSAWLDSLNRPNDAPSPASRSLVLPLGGNNSQVIDPWTLMLRLMNAQFGFININMGKSRDP